MHSFFTDPATHIGPEGQLHVWAMAKAEVRSALAPFAQVCDAFDCLGLQPPSALHATVLRLAPHDSDVAAFCAAFRRECDGLESCTCPCSGPRLWKILLSAWGQRLRSGTGSFVPRNVPVSRLLGTRQHLTTRHLAHI